jgi:hypothetical protein
MMLMVSPLTKIEFNKILGENRKNKDELEV